jgi:hypothetical protein
MPSVVDDIVSVSFGREQLTAKAESMVVSGS